MSRRAWLAEHLHELFDELDDTERRELDYHWHIWARSEQLPPPGSWNCWLICAGRGFGKTRAGAEWVREIAQTQPDARIALVGATLPEARAVMVEGESGLLACTPLEFKPTFEPSLKRLTWPNGAQGYLYSAAEAESLRGPQHSHAWCDEIAKWENASDRATRSWDNMLMGLRLGDHPRVLATTTPRAVPLMRRLIAEADTGRVVITRGSTYANAAHLPEIFVETMRSQFGSTTLGRQELDGQLLDEIEGALWTRAMLDKHREKVSGERMERIVVGVDPPVSARGDECGIIVAGVATDGIARVLSDASMARPSPERWARAVALGDARLEGRPGGGGSQSGGRHGGERAACGGLPDAHPPSPCQPRESGSRRTSCRPLRGRAGPPCGSFRAAGGPAVWPAGRRNIRGSGPQSGPGRRIGLVAHRVDARSARQPARITSLGTKRKRACP